MAHYVTARPASRFVPADQELLKAAALLPNPRKLLSLEVPGWEQLKSVNTAAFCINEMVVS